MKRATIAIAAVSAAAFAAPAVAPAGNSDIRSPGKCSGSSSAKIKVKPRDGRLEVEFEVDQNRNGVVWKVKLKDYSKVVFRGRAKTKAPSGSFSVERRVDDRPGTDSLKGIARNPGTGERCVAKVKI